MAKLAIHPGSTDVSVLVWVQDSASTAGAGKTGLAYNTAGLSCYYARPGAAAAALTLVSQTVSGAHADGGFVEVDATNMPGLYRLDLSDAIVASGARSAVVMLHGASGMAPVALELDLAAQVDATRISGDATAADNLETACDGGAYNMGGGAVVAASVSGNVGGNVTGSVGSVASGGITAASIATGAIDADALATDAVAEIADGVWDEALAGHAAAGSAGKALSDAGAAGNPWEVTGLESLPDGSAGNELHLCKAALVNKTAHDQVARTRAIYDDAGAAPLVTLQSTSDSTGEVITEAPLP